MPRDSNGNYTLPLADVIGGQPITATWANETMADIAAAMTDSLSRSGDGGMEDPFTLFNGSSGAPGLSFIDEPTMGWYRAGSGDLRGVVGGVDQVRFQAAGPEFWDDTESAWIALKELSDNVAELEANKIPEGTVQLFAQANAPVGWSPVDTSNDVALRLVSSGGTGGGTGGSVDFSAAFNATRATSSAGSHSHTITVAAQALSIGHMPAHNHGGEVFVTGYSGGGSSPGGTTTGFAFTTSAINSQGSGATHNHPGSSSNNTGAHSHTSDLAVKYVDIIQASKDAY